MKASLKDIANITGFSTATVSNALNGKRGVSRANAERILSAARSCGYVGVGRASSVRLLVCRQSGLVVSDTPFFSELIAGVEDALRSSGYEMTVSSLDFSDVNARDALRLMLSDASTALLVLATELTEADAAVFQSAAAPVVMLDACFERTEFNSVLISNEASAARAAEYLLDMGHRRIGYLVSSMRIQNFKEREAGLRRGLAGRGLALEEGCRLALTPTIEGARADMAALLRAGTPLPTAFFADNDLIAFGAMSAMGDAGIAVPERVSVVGFDDMPFCQVSSPPLTTVRVFKRELGRVAALRIAELIRGGGMTKTKIQVCNEFIERRSVKRWNG